MASLDWTPLGKVQYRKWDMYDMEWILNPDELSNYVISGAPYGGPIAMLRDHTKLVKQGDSESNFLRIYTSAGNEMAAIPWEEGRLAPDGMGWTANEMLVCVLDDGRVQMYDIQGNEQRQLSFSLLPPTDPDTIKLCVFWSGGLVVLTADMKLIHADNLTGRGKPTTIRLADPGIPKELFPTCMAILEPQFTKNGDVEVLLATQTNSMVVVTANRAEDMKLQDRVKTVITNMAVAPNGRFVACFTQDGTMVVLTSSLTTQVISFDAKASTAPAQMIWCGEDSVILHWKNFGCMMVGPYGHCVKFPYDGSLYLCQEADCCRIFTTYVCEILQRVPETTEEITKIGSTSPAAMLFDAQEAFECGDAKADENIRSIEEDGHLPEAVTQCIHAAGMEFDVDRQRSLLKAASYGQHFCGSGLTDYDDFADTCRNLRVLNAIRDTSIGIPLTSAQYHNLTPEVLVNRLIVRNHHFLASKICTYLKIKKDTVLVHWAREKIAAAGSETTDEELLQLIRRKLQNTRGLSYQEIARCAAKAGRQRLASMMLDFEPNAEDQVPLLMSLGEHEAALQKAIASGDTDLMYLALLHLERTVQNEDEFHRLIFTYPMAVSLLIVYYKSKQGPKGERQLQNLYYYPGRHLEAGNMAIGIAYTQEKLDDRRDRMKIALEMYQQSKDLTFQAKATEEQLTLLTEQQKLEKLTGHPCFVDTSVSDTIYNLVCLATDNQSYLKSALKIQKTFKVPEKRYYHLKVKAMAETGQWKHLHEFSQEKKPPIGFRPFAEACLRQKQMQEAERYISKISKDEEKYKIYCKVGMWQKAVDIAFKLKDHNKLVEIHTQTKDASVKSRVEGMLESMQ